MKTLFIIISLICFQQTIFAQDKGNYFLIIDQDSVWIDINKPISHTTKKGEVINIELAIPDILTFSDNMFSFSYPKGYSVSNTDLEVGVEQFVLMNSTGNGFLIQKYSSFDPSSLTSLMLNEITKESVSYGYKKTEKNFKHQLKSGETIEGKQATLTYRGEKEVYTVASYGGKDEGLLIVTILVSEGYPDDEKMIKTLLNTLEIH